MKNRKALYLLLGANAISSFAQGISIIAIPWYFIHLLDMPKYYGIAYAVITGLTLPWSLYAGTIVDRFSRKKIFLWMNVAGFIVLGSCALSGYMLGQIPPGLVMLALGTTIFIFNVHYPTLYAFGQEITERENYSKLNSTLEVLGQATSMISGAAAALLLGGTVDDLNLQAYLPFEVEPWSLHQILLLDAATYGITFLLITQIKYIPVKLVQRDTGSFKERFIQGIQFLRERKELFWFGIGSYAIFITLIVQAFFLMSIYVSNHLEANATVYGAGELLYALGAFLAGIIVARVIRSNRVRGIMVLMLVAVSVYLLVAFTQSVWVLFGFSLILGFCNAGTRILRITYLFNHISNRIIGRANSIFNSLNIAFRTAFIGIFSITFFSEGSNITWAYFILAAFIFIGLIPILIYSGKLKRLATKDPDQDA